MWKMYMNKKPPVVYQYVSYFIYRTGADCRRHLRITVSCIIICCLCVWLTLHMCSYGNIDATTYRHVKECNGKTEVVDKAKNMDVFLVVLILTSPSALERRDTIRKTWFTYQTNDILKVFAIGAKGLSADRKKQLEQEHERHNDLLFLQNFTDAYANLSMKTLLSFQWINEHINFKYIFKGDDDTFVKLDIMYNILLTARHKHKLYWGYFQRGNIKRSGVWAETDFVLCDRYLPYALGGGYVLSQDLVNYIALNIDLLLLLKSEDVSVGLWLAPLAINRIHDIRFDTQYKSRGCSNKYIVTHKQSIRDMTEKFAYFKQFGAICRAEVATMHGYVYNWTAVPAECCNTKYIGVPSHIIVDI